MQKTPNSLKTFSFTKKKDVKAFNKFSLFTTLPLAACNKFSLPIIENSIGPDFIETQSNIFVAGGNNDRDFDKTDSSENLTVISGNGNDNITTGSGNDTVDGKDGNDIINGDGGDDVLSGGDGYDIINGGDGDDILNSGLNDGGLPGDILNGGNGDDTLNASYNRTIMIGGPGADTLNGVTHAISIASYEDSPAGININLSTNSASGGDAEGDILINIDHIQGSNFDDVITGNDQSNSLKGHDGNDSLFGFEGDDYLFGGAGADIINGGEGRDTAGYYNSPTAVDINLGTNSISGGHADGDTLIDIEEIRGSAFDDIIVGNDQDNYFVGYDGNDTLSGGIGDDALLGSDGDDILNGGIGNDSLYGNAGIDILNGDDGDDSLLGGAGADILNGGNGIDTARYSSTEAAVIIDLSLNTAKGGDAEGDTLLSIENIRGTAYDDVLTGDDQDNYLHGGISGNDTLSGKGGNDTLFGNGYTDILDGGSGDDHLLMYGYYTGTDQSTYDGGIGNDTLVVFNDFGLSPSLNFDLSTYNLSNIEILDITNTTNTPYYDNNDREEHITLTIDDILNATDTNNELRIDGNANDSVTSIGEGWMQEADQNIGSDTYHVYAANGATLLIDSDIIQDIS